MERERVRLRQRQRQRERERGTDRQKQIGQGRKRGKRGGRGRRTEGEEREGDTEGEGKKTGQGGERGKERGNRLRERGESVCDRHPESESTTPGPSRAPTLPVGRAQWVAALRCPASRGWLHRLSPPNLAGSMGKFGLALHHTIQPHRELPASPAYYPHPPPDYLTCTPTLTNKQVQLQQHAGLDQIPTASTPSHGATFLPNLIACTAALSGSHSAIQALTGIHLTNCITK